MNSVVLFQTLRHRETGEEKDMVQLSMNWRKELSELLGNLVDEASDGELAALISFALAFPEGFMALVDTYDVLRYHVVAPLCFLSFVCIAQPY